MIINKIEFSESKKSVGPQNFVQLSRGRVQDDGLGKGHETLKDKWLNQCHAGTKHTQRSLKRIEK